MRFERAAIVGVGLIGGSLALAARQAGLIGEVVGIGRSQQNLDVARARGLIDRAVADLADVGAVDLVVLAVPVRSTASVMRTLLPHVRPGTIVTDVGSVKGEVVAAMEALLPAGRPFVGAHPIAGSERAGAAEARADLFRGAPCILTPTSRTPRPALARVRALWEGVGARVDEMTPEAHDRALAFVSHLPHVVAYALVRGLGDPGLAALAGGSWRDATRVAESRAELWCDILLANADAVVAATESFAAEVERFRQAVVAGDAAALTALLEEATSARQRQSALAAVPRPAKAREP